MKNKQMKNSPSNKEYNSTQPVVKKYVFKVKNYKTNIESISTIFALNNEEFSVLFKKQYADCLLLEMREIMS